CARDGGAVLCALPQTAAIDAEERHHTAETVADPIIDLVERGGGTRRDDLAHERLEANTFGQRVLSLAAAAALNDQRDDECCLQSDEPCHAYDMPAVLLPERWLVEDDLAVLGQPPLIEVPPHQLAAVEPRHAGRKARHRRGRGRLAAQDPGR